MTADGLRNSTDEHNIAPDIEDTEAGQVDQPIEELARLVEFLANHLVEDPDQMKVTPQRYGTNVHIKLTVSEDDMGRVIGRNGRIARAMRTLLTIAASRKGLRASLDIDT